MSKQDFRQRVLEQQIFEDLKDTSVKSGEYFRKKYSKADINHSRLYRKIVNYQIKEYGCTLDNYVPKKNPGDLISDYRKARQRRYSRRNR